MRWYCECFCRRSRRNRIFTDIRRCDCLRVFNSINRKASDEKTWGMSLQWLFPFSFAKRKEKNVERKPSEIITDFLNFLETAKYEYESAYEAVGKEDAKTQTFMHDLEFAPDVKARNKIATRFQASRKERRRQKDRSLLYEHFYNFYTDKKNGDLLKTLRRLQNEQIGTEKYLFGQREFKNRIE